MPLRTRENLSLEYKLTEALCQLGRSGTLVELTKELNRDSRSVLLAVRMLRSVRRRFPTLPINFR